MNNSYKVSFKDDLGRIHTMRLMVAHDAPEPSAKDAEPFIAHYLEAYGRTVSGRVTVKREKGRK